MSERDLPCNFLKYLEWRLEEKADTTAQLLGEWLANYEPQRAVGGSPTLRATRSVPEANAERGVQVGSRCVARYG